MYELSVLLVLKFLSSITATTVSHTAPDLSAAAPFIPRSILYYCYKFPVRSDGTLTAFSDEETERGRKAISDEELAKVLYPRKEYSTVKNLIRQHVALRDVPFWRDVPLHHMLDMNVDLDRATSAWMAEPAFTKTHAIEKRERDTDHYGTVIKQIYEPFGFPFEVPCYSNNFEQSGLTNIFYKLQKRNFASTPLQWILHKTKKFRAHPFLTDAVHTMAEYKKTRPAALVAMPQLIGRDTGAFTHNELKNFLKKPDGKLTISPFLDTLSRLESADIKPWGTLACAALVDNEPRSLGVVTNVDYLVNEPREFMYKDIKVIELEDKKPDGEKEPLPILDISTNLKVDISWDEWSCCSACCCTGILCGKFYTPDRKCTLLPSMKFRKGYLSLMKIDPEKPIQPWDSNPVTSEFQAMMSISPYRERGIALWSTMWESAESLKEAKEYKNKLYDERFVEILNDTVTRMEAHPGYYIDEIPCNEEKYDCLKLAECRGINIKTKVEEEIQEELEPCAEYETEIETIFIDQEHSDIELLPKRSYRIRVREEAFATDATRIHWRVSSRPPARYDTSRACLEQGIVQLKGGDLLLTSLTSRDVRRRIQGTLADGRKINIQLHNAGVKLGLGDDNRKFLTWTAIITAFLAFLYEFIRITSERRKARMKQILQSRMKKRLRAQSKLRH